MNEKTENNKNTETELAEVAAQKNAVVRSDTRQGKNGTYDEWCEEQKCEQYIEWECPIDTQDGEQPYPCVSCKLQGQSYNINEIAEDCPHK